MADVIVLVTGYRHWNDLSKIEAAFNTIDDSSATITLVHGDCSGAYRMAAAVGRTKGWKIIAVPAQWSRYGRSAGPRRNKDMIETYHLCIPSPQISWHSTVLEITSPPSSCAPFEVTKD